MKQPSFNQTAYRILLLLKWLTESSLTYQEINLRFKTDPLSGKSLSQDAFWLYINTLKSLGCKINRPKKSNEFRYQLFANAFSHYLTVRDVQTLRDTIVSVEDQLDFWDIVHFQQWVIRVFTTAANKNRHELEDRFFEERRNSPLHLSEASLHELEDYCHQKQLLKIHYASSSKKSEKTILFLPYKLFHHQGVPYLLGQNEGLNEPSMLRLERILGYTPITDEIVQKRLLEKQLLKGAFIIRLHHYPLHQHEAFGEDETAFKDPSDERYVIVCTKTDNSFLLQQKLLALGYSFQILYPSQFKSDIQQSLHQMRLMYNQ